MSLKGFIKNPTINTLGWIKPSALIERAEKNGHSGSGLHYEIYHVNVLHQLAAWHDAIDNDHDKNTFSAAAKERGYSFDRKSMEQAIDAKDELMRELQDEMF